MVATARKYLRRFISGSRWVALLVPLTMGVGLPAIA